MLKKTILAVLGLAANGLVMAGAMGPVCSPDLVTVPCETNAWDLGVQALYLKSTFSGSNDYDFQVGSGLQNVKHDWDWGYKLEGSYHFSTGNDLTLTWLRYSADFNQDNFSGFVPFIDPLNPVPASLPFTLAQEHTFDQVNAVLAQHTDFGLRKNARFYAGFQYADIRVDAENHFAVNPLISQYHNSDFNGVGPVVGVDYSYDLAYGIHLTSNGAVSILYGTGRYSDGFKYASGLMVGQTYSAVKMIVPGLEVKLGANYIHPLAHGLLTIEGGYQALNYFDPLQTQGPATAGNLTNSNYGLFGPYLGAKWIGSV